MISFKQSMQVLQLQVKTLSLCDVNTELLDGYVLAEDIRATLNMPPFDKSLRDGYAVKAKETVSTKDFQCIGVSAAGKAFAGIMGKGECVKIMTGAPLPEGADAVIMVEKSKPSSSGRSVRFFEKALKGQFVCRKAQDIKKGKIVLKKGTKLSISNIALISSMGKKTAKVFRKPKIAIVSTGREILSLGKKRKKFCIYDANGPMLEALAAKEGCRVVQKRSAKDSEDALVQVLQKGLQSDVMIISGGVSKGDYDFVPKVLGKLGVREMFHRVRIKPGRPIYFGKKGRTLVFGLPGNPLSVFVTYMLYVRTAMKRMSGEGDYLPVFEKGIINKEFSQKDSARQHYVLTTLKKKNGERLLDPIRNYDSGSVQALSEADGFIEVERNVKLIKKGTKVRYFSWKE